MASVLTWNMVTPTGTDFALTNTKKSSRTQQKKTTFALAKKSIVSICGNEIITTEHLNFFIVETDFSAKTVNGICQTHSEGNNSIIFEIVHVPLEQVQNSHHYSPVS